ncbi:MAG: DUF3179 domain-containing protein [Actinomycetota bacterium]|nr:DUF3179 domain-containing protein [Actinomycetota bacterium]MDK1026800.1 DUF3179 domain-containing protein [Actinomycetota bacterium]MDK1038409.1 DUF3179 domain-containing protein [Actinomycetota bacterium]MDK1095768.1 DUF3179 domain-containing protein [Actinomycetota bacterium]MDK1102471.1 DUF3179 domain-containing protein [Actinomycetota bacterium]
MSARITMMVAAGALLLAACVSATVTNEPEATEDTASSSDSTSSSTVGSLAPAVGALPDGPSALDTMFAEEFPDPLIDPGDVISGGPPPDGIPPIDNPVFLDVADNLELLPGGEPVVVLEINGDARAYPIRAMVWHEIVNDTVGGIPVSVTYCPLCNSAAAYERTINGVETTFGTSGRLFASALIMYDRATESLWTHFNGLAVIGVLTGFELVEHPAPLMAWELFRSTYPTGKVLDWTRTGFSRDYGRNPYTGYDDPESTPFLFRGALDDRAAAMQRVIGVEHEGDSGAFALEVVSGGAGKATAVTVGDASLVIFWLAGQASALDTAAISEGRDVGSTGVFVPRAAGRDLTFTHDGDNFIDVETGSVWLINGEAVEGALAGERLTQLPHLDTFWFAWSTYQPDTSLQTE